MEAGHIGSGSERMLHRDNEKSSFQFLSITGTLSEST